MELLKTIAVAVVLKFTKGVWRDLIDFGKRDVLKRNIGNRGNWL